MYVADVMRHRATHGLWSLAAFGEVVAVTHAGPNKALAQRGQLGRFLFCQSWSNEVTFVLTTDSKGRSQ
eukprot:5702944-Prorocentrum_lima.AAC.1